MTSVRKAGIGRVEIALMIAGSAALALLPFGVHDIYMRHLIIMVFIYGVVAASWDLSLGYAGIFNFGHVAFFGIGLYTYCLTAKLLGLDPWLALLVGGLASGLAAALISVPILRLKGIYVILVTFAFSQLVLQIILSQSDVTGGNEGLVRVPTFVLGSHNMMRDGKLAYYYIALVMLCLCTVALRAFVRSPLGLSVRAMRDNEEYAVSRGISIARLRLITLMLSGMLAGLAGAFYGGYFRNASTDVFGPGLLTLILSMVLLGGTSTIYGSLLASFFLTFFGEMTAYLGAWRPIIIGGLIILVMLVCPDGLAGLMDMVVQRVARAYRRRKYGVEGPDTETENRGGDGSGEGNEPASRRGEPVDIKLPRRIQN